VTAGRRSPCQGLAAAGLFASYAEFLLALVLADDAAKPPLSVVMTALARNTYVSWRSLDGAIFLVVLPSVVLVAIDWGLVAEGILVRVLKG
jgi:ABC-type maltose transport system permease subunit